MRQRCCRSTSSWSSCARQGIATAAALLLLACAGRPASALPATGGDSTAAAARETGVDRQRPLLRRLQQQQQQHQHQQTSPSVDFSGSALPQPPAAQERRLSPGGSGVGAATSSLSRRLGPVLDGLDTVGRAVEAAAAGGIVAAQQVSVRRAENELQSAASTASRKLPVSSDGESSARESAAAEQRPQERQLQEQQQQQQQQEQQGPQAATSSKSSLAIGDGGISRSGNGGKRSAQVGTIPGRLSCCRKPFSLLSIAVPQLKIVRMV